MKNGKSFRLNYEKKAAFTLAEILITLGIIGMVAALTMPSLIGNYKKQQTITQLRKAYSALNQAYRMSVLENGEFKNWDLDYNSNVEDYFNKYWKPYLKVVKVCKDYKDCGFEKELPWLQVDGSVSWEYVQRSHDVLSCILADGTFITFRTPPKNQPNNDPKIRIDTNGYKKPNMNCKDYFWFVLTEKGVVPMDSNLLYDEINENVKTGYSCLAKIFADGWIIKEDYPWIK